MARSGEDNIPTVPKVPKVPKERKVRQPKEKKVKVPRAKGDSIPLKEKLGDLLRNKVVLGIIVIVLCILIVFVVSPLLTGLVSKRVPVVVLEHSIERGTQITEEHLKITTIGETDRPNGSATEKAQVIGTFTTIDMLAGDILTSSKLSPIRPLENPYLYELEQGKIALSVEVQGLAEGLTGKLKAGDIVTLFAVFNSSTIEEEEIQAVAFPELQYVKVLASTSATANDIDVDNPPLENTEREVLPATLTLEVSPYQAQTLAGLNKNATVHTGLVARADNEELCNAFLLAQDEYIKSLTEDGDEQSSEEENRPEVSEPPESSEASSSADTEESVADSSEDTSSSEGESSNG